MKRHRLFPICTVLVTICLSFHTANAQEDFVVIVNKDVLEVNLDRERLRRIYFGFETKWEDSQMIKLSYADFANSGFWETISTSKSNYHQFWIKREDLGNGIAPVAMSSSQSIVDYVSNTSGAIGIVESSLLNEIGDDCKAIMIDKVSP